MRRLFVSDHCRFLAIERSRVSCSMSRKRCTDPDVVLEVLLKHVASPDAFKYRVDLDGPTDAKELSAHSALLLALRSATKAPLTQTACESALSTVASKNESTWHLGRSQHKWAAKASRRLRAMIRDIDQGLVKARTRTHHPEWLVPFLPGDADAAAADAMAERRTPEEFDFGWDADQEAPQLNLSRNGLLLTQLEPKWFTLNS